MIREMKSEDISVMAKEGRSFFKYMGLKSSIEYREEHVMMFLGKALDHPQMKVLVADRDGGLTAFMGGLVHAPFYNLDHPVLMEFIWWTSEKGRGNGDGIRVLKRLEQWAASMGAKSSVVEVLNGALEEPTSNMLMRMGYGSIEHRFMKDLVD